MEECTHIWEVEEIETSKEAGEVIYIITLVCSECGKIEKVRGLYEEVKIYLGGNYVN
jgi:hypothetical protein